MEHAIGSIITIYGEKYEICEANITTLVSHCLNCAFRHQTCNNISGIGECSGEYREDKKDVIFKKVISTAQEDGTNKKLDLVEILKDCPEGTKLYLSVIDRDVLLRWVRTSREYPIRVVEERSKVEFDITGCGRMYKDFLDGEIVLFPSKDQRDWSKFKAPVKKSENTTLKPFDMVLVRNANDFLWRCNFFSHFFQNVAYCTAGTWDQVIPYNAETKHLVGTKGMPDEKYIWWKKNV